MMVQMTNNTKKELEIDPSDIQCLRGSNKGSLRHNFGSSFRIGVIVLAPEESRTDLLYCNFGAKGTGNITVKVDQVYEANEDTDKRKVVAKNLSWEIVSTGTMAE